MARAPVAGLDRDDLMEAVSEGVRKAFVDLGSDYGRKDVPHELLFDAVREGTREAIWQMITNATAAPCGDFYDTVHNAILEAFSDVAERVELPRPGGDGDAG